MNLYEVTLHGNAAVFATVEIKAESEDEAKSLAYDEWSIDWEVDDEVDIDENRSIASLIEEDIETDDE